MFIHVEFDFGKTNSRRGFISDPNCDVFCERLPQQTIGHVRQCTSKMVEMHLDDCCQNDRAIPTYWKFDLHEDSNFSGVTPQLAYNSVIESIGCRLPNVIGLDYESPI